MNRHFPYGLRLEPIQARNGCHANNIAPSMSCSEVDAHRFLCHNSDFLVLATGIRPGTGALRPVTWALRRSSSCARPFSIVARLVRLPPLGPNRSQRQGHQPRPTEGLSWWMRLLSQNIAQRANKEDGEVGKFFQAR